MFPWKLKPLQCQVCTYIYMYLLSIKGCETTLSTRTWKVMPCIHLALEMWSCGCDDYWEGSWYSEFYSFWTKLSVTWFLHVTLMYHATESPLYVCTILQSSERVSKACILWSLLLCTTECWGCRENEEKVSKCVLQEKFSVAIERLASTVQPLVVLIVLIL